MHHILVYDPISRAGGGTSYLHNIAEGLSDCHNHPFRYTFVVNSILQGHLESLEQRARVVYAPRQTAAGGIRGYLWRCRNSRCYIEMFEPDVILSMNQVPYKADIPVLLFLRNALYFSLDHNWLTSRLTFSERIKYRMLKAITLAGIRNTTAVVTSTNSFADMVRPTAGRFKRNVHVAAFGCNKGAHTIPTRTYKKAQYSLLCLQYNFYKGHDIALLALEQLKKRGLPVVLQITDNLARHRDPRARSCHHKAVEKGLSDSIHYLNKVPHGSMTAVYDTADLFLFPSFIESFGQGLLEAMSRGVPCIVSDIPVFHELAGDSAVYFQPGDSLDLADKVALLLENESMRRALSLSGPKVAGRYTWAHHVTQLESIFTTLCNNRRNTPA